MNIWKKGTIILVFILATLYEFVSSEPSAQHLFPVIGIISLNYRQTTLSYVNGVNVKFAQMSGAHVVPIYTEGEPETILELLQKVNGVVFEGGTMHMNITNNWTQNIDTIFKYAREQNDKGNVFPIIGQCLGLHLLSYLSAGYNNSILTSIPNDFGAVHPLHITNETSDIYSELTPYQLEAISSGKGFSYFHHNYGITLETYEHNQHLQDFWKLTSWAETIDNLKFVASFQARNYPFYGLQYHPQISVYEWTRFTDRSKVAMEVAQALSMMFVQKAKQSQNRFPEEELLEKNIYNLQATYRPRKKGDSLEIYVFDEVSKDKIEM